MFLLALFMLRRRRYVTYRHVTVRHVYWKHPRFHHPLYWISGLAFLEFSLWIAAAELLGYWWLLWLAARGITSIVRQRRTVSPQWTTALAAARPVWPRAAVPGGVR